MRAGDVGKRLVDGDPPSDFATTRDIVRGVAQIDSMLVPLEERRRDRKITISGEAVADAADMRIHPEDLLGNDQPAARLARWVGSIGDALEADPCARHRMALPVRRRQLSHPVAIARARPTQHGRFQPRTRAKKSPLGGI
jgi:hypothetical protein